MNQKLFRYASIDQEVDIGTTAAGIIFELELPRSHRFRYVWCYYDNRSFSAVGDEAWIRFYNEGQLSIELPAALIPLPGTRLGMANYPEGVVSGSDQANSSAAVNVGGPGVMWWDNNTSTTIAFACHAFRVVADADLVRLESNKEGNTRALLAVFSADASP